MRLADAEPSLGPGNDNSWVISSRGFDPLKERAVESLLALANGYVGVRASLQEGHPASSPGSFIAGVFDYLDDNPQIPQLVRLPDWFALRFNISGQTITLEEGDVIDHERQLDMRRGLLIRRWRHCDRSGRITFIEFQQFVSQADQHALAQRIELTAENYSATVRLESPFAAHRCQGQEERAENHSLADQADLPGLNFYSYRTRKAGLRVEAAILTATLDQASPDAATVATDRTPTWHAEAGKTYRVDRFISLFTSRDVPDPAKAAASHVQTLASTGYEALRQAHEAAWADKWHRAAIEIEGDPPMALAAHLAAYHLISAANASDERVSIGARGLSGDAYGGHVFWDTEIFMLPFFLASDPGAARTLLMYRYHTLDAARDKAKQHGYRGALYAWESADSGEDVTPSQVTLPGGAVLRVLCGEIEHHISADVAYGVWTYWRATGDDDFFVNAGAEIMLETARFWASRVSRDEDGKYHILGVIGPDEYHENVDDNAFTNIMAKWNLRQGSRTAMELAQRWPERWLELCQRLSLTLEETTQWLDIARNLVVLVREDGLIEQFQGYFALQEVDLHAPEFRGRLPVSVVLGEERLKQTQVIKQADVLMALSLLWYDFPRAQHYVNFHYYEPRTAHGSSLSPGVHAEHAARLDELGIAERYLRQTASIDLDDQMANAAGGVHMAALGSLWGAIVEGFAGVHALDDALSIAPRLALRWRRLRLRLQWRGRWLMLDARSSPPSCQVRLEAGEPLVATRPGEADRLLTQTSPLALDQLGQRWQLKEEVRDESRATPGAA